MTENDNHIHIDVGIAHRDFQQPHDMEVEASFEIPVSYATRPMSIAGLILHVIGWVILIAMAVLAIINNDLLYTEFVGDPTDGSLAVADQVRDVEARWTLMEWLMVLGFVGSAFLFTGLAFYTYGRTQQGGEELEAESSEVVHSG